MLHLPQLYDAIAIPFYYELFYVYEVVAKVISLFIVLPLIKKYWEGAANHHIYVDII